jgi:hypothetical protein
MAMCAGALAHPKPVASKPAAEGDSTGAVESAAGG